MCDDDYEFLNKVKNVQIADDYEMIDSDDDVLSMDDKSM
jgi:hypothetical protein